MITRFSARILGSKTPNDSVRMICLEVVAERLTWVRRSLLTGGKDSSQRYHLVEVFERSFKVRIIDIAPSSMILIQFCLQEPF